MKKSVSFVICILGLLLYTSSNASIISTEVIAKAELSYQDENSNTYKYGSVENSGITGANAVVEDSLTGAGISTEISLDPLDDEMATVNFTIGWKSPIEINDQGYTDWYELGGTNSGAVINYYAEAPTTLLITYDFTYSGLDAFGLNPVYFMDYSNNILDQVGETGYSQDNGPSNYTGSIEYDIVAGNFWLKTIFYPNVGSIVPRDSQLSGSITLDFQGGSEYPPVPEPNTMLLFGVGILGLAGINRGKK